MELRKVREIGKIGNQNERQTKIPIDRKDQKP